MKVPPSDAARLILRARKAAGLSQSDLARRAGMPHSVVSAYEHGKRDPGAKALARLLGAAGFRLTVARNGPDPEHAGRTLEELLDFADKIPTRRRPDELDYPRLHAIP